MATGGKSQGVYAVSDAEIASGAFRVRPGKAIKVVGMTAATRGVLAGPLTPVYVVSDPSVRGVEGGEPIPVSNLTTGTRVPDRGLAIPVYVVADDGQFEMEPEPEPCQSELCQAMIGYWKLDEASGAPLNSVPDGPNTIFYPGEVGSAEGGRGPFDTSNFWAFVDDEYDAFSLEDTSFTFWTWFKTDMDSFGGFCAVDEGGPASASTWAIFTTPPTLTFQVYDGVITGSADAEFDSGEWNLVIVRFNHTNQRGYISINGGAWQQTDNALEGVIETNPAWAWYIGVTLGVFPFDGLMKQQGFALGYTATDADRDFLWNNGAGVTYEDIVGF